MRRWKTSASTVSFMSVGVSGSDSEDVADVGPALVPAALAAGRGAVAGRGDRHGAGEEVDRGVRGFVHVFTIRHTSGDVHT